MNLSRTYLAHKHCRTAHTWTSIRTTTLIHKDGRREPRAHRVCGKCGAMDQFFIGTVIYYNIDYHGRTLHQILEFREDGEWYNPSSYNRHTPYKNATIIHQTYGLRGKPCPA